MKFFKKYFMGYFVLKKNRQNNYQENQVCVNYAQYKFLGEFTFEVIFVYSVTGRTTNYCLKSSTSNIIRAIVGINRSKRG